MNLNLAAMYGTPGAQPEEQTKLAEAELFSKLAAENGIDLNRLTNDQIQELWTATFAKTAEEDAEHEKKESVEKEKGEDEEEDEKKEAAALEHRTKVAQAEEEQRAHYLGQVMAHSYVAELSKIAAAREAGETVETPTELDKEAAMPPALAKALGKVKSVAGAGADKAKAFGSKAKELGAKGVAKTKEVGSKGVAHVKEHKGAYGAGAAGAGGAGAGFAAGRFGKKKESSALDALAIEAAVKIAHADGRFDIEEVAERVGHIFGLGLDESTKVAGTLEAQVEVRALEFLEAAGYPVEWN